MNEALTIARKELRSYFGSPMALIFIGAFLAATLFSFFWVDTFFARGIADVRPLFRWMPVLMIFLVAALTMRQWSEEQRSGTLEILLTLPVSTTQLVAGKFLAVVGLVVVALALTLTLPITVEFLGDLDWGPVFGGYLASVLLAGAYAAIGLFISSRTDNQIVALISTVLLCGLFYLVGSPGVTDFAGNEVGQLLRAIGAGSRFESIERGVVDMRDLLYYATLTGVFLTLNVLSLKAQGWSKSERTEPYRRATALTSLLLVLNLVVANVWAYPLRGLRLDLTEQREYSLSPTTRDLLAGLQEPLLIRGYFSQRTHPLLAPLIPQISDMLEEYRIASGGRIQLEIVDPAQDPELEAEANQVYGIRPNPFQVSGRYEAAVINSYFDVLVQYGDQNTVLSFSDLIEVQPRRDGTVDVRLRNLEYDLTSTIKKAVYGFQSTEAILASLAEPARLTIYMTPQTLPDWLADVPETIAGVVEELEEQSEGQFTYTVINPDAPDSPVTRDELYELYGLQPLAESLFAEESYYLYMILNVGDEAQVIYPSGELSEADVRNAIESALKRASTGFLQVVGLWTPPATPTQDMFGQMQQPLSTWNQVADALRQEYDVRPVDLSTGMVPPEVDVLVVVAPQNFTDRERYTVDQYLMRGGSVIVAAGNYTIDLDQMAGGLLLQPVSAGLREMLAHYGVEVQESLVLDPQNEPFPMPQVREVSGVQVQEFVNVDYPYFVDVRPPEGMAKQHPIVSNLPAVTLNWVSPLNVEEVEGRESTVLLRSSDQSWSLPGTQATIDTVALPPDAEQQSYPLAVALRGSFESYFAGRPSPFEEAPEADPAAPPAPETPRLPGTLTESPEETRLVVIGSNEFVDDVVFQISSALNYDRYLNSLKLVQNAVAWTTEDLDLLGIRARGTASRVLVPLDNTAQSLWEAANYVVALLSLVLLGVVWNIWQRNEQPLNLLPPETFEDSEQEDNR